MDNCSEVPLSVILNRLAVPFKLLVPVNVAVPADAVKVPLTSREAPMEKAAAVVTVPVTDNALMEIVPAPEIVLEDPLRVIVPPVDVKLPLTDKLPVKVKLVAVLTVPEMVRLSKVKPVPVIVFVVPVMVTVPPAAWVNDPGPVVDKLPPIEMALAAAAVILEAVKERLLKLCVPVPLIEVPAPLMVMVPVLPLNTPLFTQFPAIVCEKPAPLKVVDAPMLRFPLTVILEAAVKLTDVPAPITLLRFPATVKSAAGNVFTAAPLALERVKLPYVCVETVWLPPSYSTVLVRLSAVVLKFTGKLLVPPIFNVAPLETVSVPPLTVVPLLAVNVDRSNVAELTVILPAVATDEFSAFTFPAGVFTPEPLILRVE